MTEQTPAPQSAPYRAQRRWLFLPFIGFGLLLVAYGAMWFKAKDQTLKSLAHWVQTEKARGLDAGYSKAWVVGFPLRFALEIEDLHRANPARGTSWTASRLRVNALPYNLQHIIIESLGPQTITFSDKRTWTFNAESALASAHWTKSGLKRLSTEIKDAAWTSSDGAEGKFKAWALQAAPAEDDTSKIRFETEILDGRIPEIKKEFEAFGQDFKSIKARGVITQAQIFATGFNSGTLDVWASQNGAAQFEDFAVLWGDANLKGKGEVSFDRLRRLSGKVNFAVHDSTKLAKALVTRGWVKGDNGENFIQAARIADFTKIRLQVSLDAQDGVLSFWGAPISELKPVYSPPVPDASASPVAGG